MRRIWMCRSDRDPSGCALFGQRGVCRDVNVDDRLYTDQSLQRPSITSLTFAGEGNDRGF